jgi:hypothetical protein
MTIVDMWKMTCEYSKYQIKKIKWKVFYLKVIIDLKIS